jgi:hypothetical protein
LAGHVDEYLLSKKEDKDEHFFAVTEHSNDVAMLLIDKMILSTSTKQGESSYKDYGVMLIAVT